MIMDETPEVLSQSQVRRQLSTSRHSSDYPFLNHSAMTLPQNLPPNVDDKSLARQRRRRTSPEDQAILEAAYDTDPKPDKAARLELVKQVALGEKEVQIWFQNRRQTSRRKSRPLLPHEIAQYQLSRSGDQSQWSSSELSSQSVSDVDARHSRDSICNTEDQEDEIPTTASESRTTPGAKAFDYAPLAQTQAEALRATEPEKQPLYLRESAPAFKVDSLRVIPTKTANETKFHTGYLANRRSAPSLHQAQSTSNPYSSIYCSAISNHGRSLRKSSSFVRLSMTGEGNATVTTKDTSSPSPPRPFQGPQPLANLIQQSSMPMKPLHRSSSGRSRDSRAWEFWCDKDTRGELEEKAEKNASGSAADAIGLLRSASGRRILGVIPSKRNSELSRHAPALKRSKLDPKRSALHRSSTSFGRLQGRPSSEHTSFVKPVARLEHADSVKSICIPGNDSDKENWSPAESDRPSENASYFGDHYNAVQMSNPPTKQKTERQAHGTSAEVRKARSISKAENIDPEADPELAVFMRGARESNSVPEEEELDCVQGLLSLSQGNWR